MFKIESAKTMLLMIIMLVIITAGFKNEPAQAAKAPASAWSFAIFGDTRGAFDATKYPPYDLATQTGVSVDLGRISAEIALLNPDFVLHVGDLIHGDRFTMQYLWDTPI